MLRNYNRSLPSQDCLILRIQLYARNVGKYKKYRHIFCYKTYRKKQSVDIIDKTTNKTKTTCIRIVCISFCLSKYFCLESSHIAAILQKGVTHSDTAVARCMAARTFDLDPNDLQYLEPVVFSENQSVSQITRIILLAERRK